MNRADRSAATVRSAYRIFRSMDGSSANVNDFLLGRDNGEGVCPEKADMFSGSQSHQRKSQKLCSLGRIRGGNETDEADRQSRHQDGEQVTGPQRK